MLAWYLLWPCVHLSVTSWYCIETTGQVELVFVSWRLSSTHPTHTHVRLTALFPGLPRWAGTRKVKPIWILLKQETVSGSGISWAICKSAPCSRQTATPAPTTLFFYRPDALPATQPTASKHWRHPALCCKEIRVFPKIRVLPLSLCPKLWTLIILPQQVNLVVNKTCPWSSFVVYTYDTWCSTTKLHWYNVPCTCRLTGWAKKIWTFLRVDT